MQTLKYNGDTDTYQVSFRVVNSNVVELTGDFPVKEGGFMLSMDGKVYNGDYSQYVTIYRNIKGGAQFSNNESVYIPPEPEPEPVIPEPYVPTFDEVRNMKISELSMICRNIIESGMDINGQHYSYKYDDQINLDKIINIVKVTGLPLGYHADDQGCAEHSAEELIDIYMQLAMNQYSQQTYFNQAKQYILSLEESDENKELISNFFYGNPLEGEYLDNYNHMMELYHAQVEALAGVSHEEDAPEEEEEEEEEPGDDTEKSEESGDE